MREREREKERENGECERWLERKIENWEEKRGGGGEVD